MSRTLLVLALLLLQAFAPVRSQGPDEHDAEYRLKAAFVYKFVGFVDWPAALQETHTINIGVLGSPVMLRELTQIVPGRSVGERALTVRAVDISDLRDLHILFIAKSEAPRLTHLATALHERGVLVITEWEGALAQGGAINFLVADRRVKFEVSLPAAEKSRIKLSSRLLGVAHRVVGAH